MKKILTRDQQLMIIQLVIKKKTVKIVATLEKVENK